MVESEKIRSSRLEFSQNSKETSELRFSSIAVSSVINGDLRFDASAHDLSRRKSNKTGQSYKLDFKKLSELVKADGIFYPTRFKRVYVSSTTPDAIGFLGSSEMLDMLPKPTKFLSPKDTEVEELRVFPEDILLSRSGTIGNTTFVNNTLASYLISEHSIRIRCIKNPGYIYAFLRSSIGQKQISLKVFGAVVDQIEPEHISDLLVPILDVKISNKIDSLIKSSFILRDKSNSLMLEAEKFLISELHLPPIDKIKTDYLINSNDIQSFSVKLSNVNCRLDASFHTPIVNSISKHLNSLNHVSIKDLQDTHVVKNIILPGRFKRVYVKKDQGVVFFGGKQLNELDPVNKKYLSISQHNKRISDELTLRENMILVTCSGTIGKVNIVPKHWDGWTANQHIMRIVPSDVSISGYIFCWLNTVYGALLIKRFIYGSVIDEINEDHLKKVLIPIIQKAKIDHINNLILDANKIRYEAYLKERQALELFEDNI